ncbi:MAG: RNA 2',3'-cyclic phosphodiesterase [Pseudomonas sp.]
MTFLGSALEVLIVQRLFVGIELPVSIRQTLVAMRVDYPSARWHPAEALHLTLSFIGQVDQQTGANMAAALVDLPATELMLTIRGAGFFGSEQKPAVLWAGVEPSSPLLQLQQEVEQRLLPLGLVADTRPYRPHITLARVKQGGDALRCFLSRNADLALPPFSVPHVCLYVSHGGSAGVHYEVIERFNLVKR